MKKSGIFFLSTTMLLLGAIIGFLLGPIKKGVYCGNHNSGNRYFGKEDDYCDDWDSEDDGDDMPF